MGVLQRVERQVAGRGDRPVATDVRDKGMRELVDAERCDPAAKHEQHAEQQCQPGGNA